MKMRLWLTLAALCGCGPQVSTLSETDAGSGGGESTGSEAMTGSESTGGATSSTGVSTTSGQADDSSSSSSTGGAPPSWCVQEHVLEYGSNLSRSFAVESPDRPRIWMQYEANGQDDAFRILEFNGYGEPETLAFELPLESVSDRIVSAPDINGDGWPDAALYIDLGFEWRAGGPEASIDAEGTPLPLLQTAGFIQYGNDTRVDLLDGIYTLLTPRLGDGAGGFTPVESIDLAPGVFPLPLIERRLLPDARALVWHCPEDDCNQPRRYDLLQFSKAGALAERWTADNVEIVMATLGVRDHDDDGVDDVLVWMRDWDAEVDTIRWLVPGPRGALSFVDVQGDIRPSETLDVDRDGISELLIDEEDGYSLRAWNGEAYDAGVPIVGTPLGAEHPAMLDLDGDGWTDIVSRNTVGGAFIDEGVWSLVPCG